MKTPTIIAKIAPIGNNFELKYEPLSLFYKIENKSFKPKDIIDLNFLIDDKSIPFIKFNAREISGYDFVFSWATELVSDINDKVSKRMAPEYELAKKYITQDKSKKQLLSWDEYTKSLNLENMEKNK